MRLINPLLVGGNVGNLRVQSCPSPVILHSINDLTNLQSSTLEWILMCASIYEKAAVGGKLAYSDISRNIRQICKSFFKNINKVIDDFKATVGEQIIIIAAILYSNKIFL